MQSETQTYRPMIARDRYDAVLFDMDGVITDTASVHASCWKIMFDEFLEKRAARTAEPFRRFDASRLQTLCGRKTAIQGRRQIS